jgi:mxaL protein
VKRPQWLSRLPATRGSLALMLAPLLFALAFFMPRWELPHDTYDYLIVFDITQSMDVEDYELGGMPVSRLTYARYAVRQVLRDLPCGTRIGWGAFAEYRSLTLLSPVEVCENYSDLLASLDNIDGRMRWANASEVGKGVYWAMRMAQQAQSKPDILFISDGHEAPPLDPSLPFTLPDDVKPGQVRGWILGAGGDTPLPIPRTYEDDRRRGYWAAHEVVQLVSEDGRRIVGAEQLSALREPHLRSVAEQAGLSYARLTTPESMSALMREARFVRRAPAPVDLYWLPVAAAVLLLIVRFRPEQWFTRRKAR